MAIVNTWVLYCQNRCANIWFHQDYTVYALNPVPGPQAPGNNNIVSLHDLGDGTVALQCGAGVNAFASMRDDYGMRVQFEARGGGFVTGVDRDEKFRLVPTGDGYFALQSATFGLYVTIGYSDEIAGNASVMEGKTQDLSQAARFTAVGLSHNPIFDLLQIGKNASGMSLAGVSLAGRDLHGCNLSLCDFTEVPSFSGWDLAGANLQKARFAGLPLTGLQISGADCTGADFTGCDFTSFTPGTPPPLLAQANLTGAVLPAGVSWSGAKMPGAALAGADLTGCDLSGPATDLTGADFSGAGVAATLFSPVYQSSGGIGGYDLRGGTDRIIAYDYESKGRLDYLICYRPGRGAVGLIQRQGADFGHVLLNGDPGGTGLGGGIGGYPLSDPADRIIAYDYQSTGNADHLVCYHPGTGKPGSTGMISILAKDAGATFTKAYDSPSGAIGGYILSGPADQIIAYDYHGIGHPDHLVCYQPGTGMISIIARSRDGSFTKVYDQHGIGGYDLLNGADQIIAYDYEGTGYADHLVCYRPGHRSIFIVKKVSDTDSPDAFTTVHPNPGMGIGGCDLTNPADRIIAYDYEGTGKLDYLLCYRPGTGNVWIVQKKPDGSFTTVVTSRVGIGECNMDNPADQIIAYDYEGTGKLNCLTAYRPGTERAWVIQKKTAGPAILAGCNLSRANLSGARLGGVDLSTGASLADANLSGAQLSGANLSGGNLSGANLSGANLSGAKIGGTNLTGASLAGTDFTGLDLTGVRFSTPLARSADPAHPTVFARCTLPYAVIGLDWSCLDLTSAIIAGRPADLTGLNAKGMRWAGADFTGLVLDGANFTGAALVGAIFTGAKLRNKASFAGASLLQSLFTGAVLDETSFAGAALGGATHSQAANFSSAYLSNCDFTQASLYGVIFTGATLAGGNKLTGATDLQETDFSDAYLAYTDFTGASLQGAKFDGACMVECVLAGANLTPALQGAVSASLFKACLQAADFQNTKLGGASLADAAITNARGMIQVRYYDEDGALTDWETIHYPAGGFPAATSFSNETVCPNRGTYGGNIQQGQTIAQMMAAPSPQTQWQPKDSTQDGRRPQE